jgi:hypothetical protein
VVRRNAGTEYVGSGLLTEAGEELSRDSIQYEGPTLGVVDPPL